MAVREVDLELWVLAPVFALAAAVSLGLVSSSLLGVDWLMSIWSPTESVDVSLAAAVSIAALGAVFVNRDSWALNDFSTIELWAVYVTVGLVIAPPFIPIVQDTILGSVWAPIAWIVQTTGFALVSYLN